MCFLIKLARHDNFNYERPSEYCMQKVKYFDSIKIPFFRSPPDDRKAEAFEGKYLLKLFNLRNNINQTFKLINSERLINYN